MTGTANFISREGIRQLTICRGKAPSIGSVNHMENDLIDSLIDSMDTVIRKTVTESVNELISELGRFGDTGTET